MTDPLPQADAMPGLNTALDLDALYPILHANHYTAGWNKKRRSLWPQPASDFSPMHWRYANARRALAKAGDWIDTDLAERRNLLMFNPVGDNDYASLRTLVAAYQMVKPGEYARAHRHAPNALRMVLDTPPGLFTVVNGVQLPMVSGDILLTPGNCWHSHFSDAATTEGAQSFWIDILDVPLVQLLEPMFYEEYPGGIQPVQISPTQSEFWFPFDKTRLRLAEQEPDENGLRRVTLASQGHIPTMALCYHQVPASAKSGTLQSTENRLFAVSEGHVVITTPSLRANARRGDVIAVPTWTPFSIEATTDSYVLEVSDAPVQRMLGFHRVAE
ncbi:MAG: cupin domain-containing protein [Pararhodobacter sp.]|nr:cupin domain-containing protein [Pararhodobacter sp.]